MSIDINNINPSRPDGLNRQDKGAAAELKSADENSAITHADSGTTDSVSLSSAAKDLAQIENSLKSLPEIDQGKVDEIKSRLENGDYQINSKNMAQKMLDMEN